VLTDSIIPKTQADRKQYRGLLDGLCRRVVLGALQRIDQGYLEIHDRNAVVRCGDDRAPTECRARMTVTDPRFYRSVAAAGAVGAGSAFINGWWRSNDPTKLMRVMLRNRDVLGRLDGVWTFGSALIKRAWYALRRNTRRRSLRNIAAHYDLSNDFYRLFLDDTMTYSCGIFERPDRSLRDASIAKLDRICGKLNLRSDDHVIEIGGGWGSFAIHAATNYGCRVTTTTISQRQFEFARDRVEQLGLTDRVTIMKKDYRDLAGKYDKLVSIEMIEAVGWQYYDVFLRKCGDLLKPEGTACIQAITMPDREYERAKRSVDFIKQHVFPGSCIPSVGAITQSITKTTTLNVAHLEDITPHYALTLRAWRDRFDARIADVRGMGLCEAFIRLWTYYLCYCEAGFRERAIGCVQLLLVGDQFRGAPPLGILPAGAGA